MEGLTVEYSYSFTAAACFPPDLPGLEVRVGGGTWQGEVSWAVTLPDGSTMMGAGGGVTRGAGCPEGDFSYSYAGPPAPTVSPAPVSAPTSAPTADCAADEELYSVTLIDSYGNASFSTLIQKHSNTMVHGRAAGREVCRGGASIVFCPVSTFRLSACHSPRCTRGRLERQRAHHRELLRLGVGGGRPLHDRLWVHRDLLGLPPF